MIFIVIYLETKYHYLCVFWLTVENCDACDPNDPWLLYREVADGRLPNEGCPVPAVAVVTPIGTPFCAHPLR